jgi:hypothetical protein
MLFTLTVVTALLADADGVTFFKGSFDKALEEARKSKQIVLVDFSAKW